MENVAMSRPGDAPIGLSGKKFLVMRTLARLHECDEEELLRSIESTELEIHDVLRDMISKDEVEASPARVAKGKRRTTFALTLNGWVEYMNALGAVYELPE
jgi:hypothetical protein